MIVLLFRTFLIYFLVLLLMRLMGKHHLGEMQPSELVSTILISNLASISIESQEVPLAASLAPVLMIVSLEILVSSAAFQSPGLNAALCGKPVVVILNGKINQKALKDLQLGIQDLMAELRMNGIFDPEDVLYACMETSGSISLFSYRNSSNNALSLPIVMEGRIVHENLEHIQVTREEVFEILKNECCPLEDIFLMTGKSVSDYLIIKKEGR